MQQSGDGARQCLCFSFKAFALLTAFSFLREQTVRIEWWCRVQGPQANMFVQMWYLIMRVLRQWKRHPIMLVGEAVQYIFIGAFVGVVPHPPCEHIPLCFAME